MTWSEVPRGVKVVMTMVSAIALLLALVPPYMGLPQQVDQNTDTLSSHGAQLGDLRDNDAEHSAEFRQILCLLTLEEGVSPVAAELECG